MIDRRTRGFTLIEMLIAIVVLTAAVSGILFAFMHNTARSADPMIRQQAIIIAQAYMEEIMLKSYNDPNGGETGSCEEGAGNRIQFDDVSDYDCVNDTAGAVDQFGNSLAGLGAYNVSVSVSSTNIGAPAVAARRIDVTVTHDAQPINISITGYRTSYY
ncbi:MAG TPA: prepilin-type N-terminal cleavage/methylation domain-containing protein [Gammaproteobacteria bacterium]